MDSGITVAASPPAGPIHEQKPQAGPTAPDARPKATELQAQTQTQRSGEVQGSAPVLIPAPARSPLRAAVLPPQAEELQHTVPRAVTDRLDQLKHRLDNLKAQTQPLLGYPATRHIAPSVIDQFRNALTRPWDSKRTKINARW